MKKTEREALSVYRKQVAAMVAGLSEEDKQAIFRTAEIACEMTNKLHIGIDMWYFLYLTATDNIPTLIKYNSRSLDLFTTRYDKVTGNNELVVRRPQVSLQEAFISKGELEFMVKTGLIKSEVMENDIHTYDTDFKIWDIKEYLTADGIACFAPLKSTTATAETDVMEVFLELHETWPSIIGENFNGKPYNRSEFVPLAKLYWENIVGDKQLHERIVKYVKVTKKFNNGLKKFIEGKQWVDGLASTPVSRKVNLA